MRAQGWLLQRVYLEMVPILYEARLSGEKCRVSFLYACANVQDSLGNNEGEKKTE